MSLLQFAYLIYIFCNKAYFVDHLSVELVELAYWLEIVFAGAKMGFV